MEQVRQVPVLLPLPKKIEWKEGVCALGRRTEISLSPACGQREFGYAQILRQGLRRAFGFVPAVTKGREMEKSIRLELEEADGTEAYRLRIGPQGAVVSGGTRGLFCGIQTLLQMAEQCGLLLPCLAVEDAPDFPVRGFYHDVTRGRVPTMETLKELADRCAYFKLNQLQLYVEHTYQFKDFSELWRDDTPLTAQDILELDAYCQARNVELVPSLATFGHLYKLLSTKSEAHLCELTGSADAPRCLVERMRHHTLDVSNPESIRLVERMLDEFLPLFSSEWVNICADETFDLGRGRSRAFVEEKGRHRAYVDFLKQICALVQKAGKKPMFWGDILLGAPELARELPQNSVCLNWNYNADVGEESVRVFRDAGVQQYCCPGVHAWMRFVSRSDDAYENIVRMCGHARKYGAGGILNTDWGDLGHINPPRMSIPGLAYGAMFSWNGAPVAREEADRAISLLAYGDRSRRLVELGLAVSQRSRFTWGHAVHFYEIRGGMEWEYSAPDYLRQNFNPEGIPACNREVDSLAEQIAALLPGAEESRRPWLCEYLLMAEGVRVFNSVGAHLYNCFCGGADTDCTAWEAASALERWWADYRQLWYAQSRPAELHLLQQVVDGLADLLRA